MSDYQEPESVGGLLTSQRQLSESALGKHMGHAVEGHSRGLLRRISQRTGFEVLRQLPFAFPVNPDIVVLTDDRKIRSLGIVAYATDAKGTDKKFYRTRLEYQQILLSWREYPSNFSPAFIPMILLYGAAEGWKKKLIEDLESTCPPTMFLPTILGKVETEAIVRDAFAYYREEWESGGKAAREHVEDTFARMPTLPDSHQHLLDLLSQTLDDKEAQSKARSIMGSIGERPVAARVPKAFQSRLRQGLALASLFPNAELDAWMSIDRRAGQALTGLLEAFVRRAEFLDLVHLKWQKSIKGHFLVAQPRRPLQAVGDGQEYAPGRPDFEDWTRLDKEFALRLLAQHRQLPVQYPNVFRAGARDQVTGNWEAFCRSWLSSVPSLVRAIQERNRDLLIDLFSNDLRVESEEWQPSHGTEGFLSLWSLCTAALAVLSGARSTWTDHKLRRDQLATRQNLDQMVESLLSADGVELINLLREVVSFCRVLLDGSLEEIAEADRPRLLSLDEPRSWIAACYGVIVTNPTHNPLCFPLRQWLHSEYPDVEWHGWPSVRSVPVSQVLESHIGRVQWQFVGIPTEGEGVIVAETRSITANNWGNKSKEMYDRVSETRRAFDISGTAGLTIGVVDGDFYPDAVAEIATGIAYDGTHSIIEVLDDLHVPIGTD